MTDMKKVVSGEKLSIPARTYNAFIDSTRFVENLRRSQEIKPLGVKLPEGVIRVKNNTGSNQARYAILGIDDPIFSPITNATGFREQIAFNTSAPDTTKHTSKFVVLFEPIPKDGVGLAWIVGLAICKVDTSSGNYADIIDANVDKLRRGTAGYPIIWAASSADTNGDYWAVIQMVLEDVGGIVNAFTISSRDDPTYGCCQGYNRTSVIPDCGAIPCLCGAYRVSSSPVWHEQLDGGFGAYQYVPDETIAFDSGCNYISDSFNIIYGDHTSDSFHWEFTAAAGTDSCVLKLVGDGSVTDTHVIYRNKWYFDPAAGNMFGLIPDCNIDQKLRDILPCGFCVHPAPYITAPDCWERYIAAFMPGRDKATFPQYLSLKFTLLSTYHDGLGNPMVVAMPETQFDLKFDPVVGYWKCTAPITWQMRVGGNWYNYDTIVINLGCGDGVDVYGGIGASSGFNDISAIINLIDHTASKTFKFCDASQDIVLTGCSTVQFDSATAVSGPVIDLSCPVHGCPTTYWANFGEWSIRIWENTI